MNRRELLASGAAAIVVPVLPKSPTRFELWIDGVRHGYTEGYEGLVSQSFWSGADGYYFPHLAKLIPDDGKSHYVLIQKEA
jgi:hypothetical protein